MQDRRCFVHRFMIYESCPQVGRWSALQECRREQAVRMSRKSRTLKKSRRRTTPTPPNVSRLKGPGDVAVMIPYLLGFRPVDSLVVAALQGPRKRFGPVLRVDLVEDPASVDEVTEMVLDVLTANRVSLVVLAAYSAASALADPLVSRVLSALAEHGIAVEDAFRADDERWWSYTCDNPQCCSPDGVPYASGTSRVAAEAVVAGLAVEADRNALRSQLAPGDGQRRDRVATAVDRLRTDVLGPNGSLDELEAALEVALATSDDLTDDEVAWLALAVQPTEGLEVAAALLDRASAAQHYRIWRQVTTAVSDDLLPPVGFLAGLAAWLDGHGVLASHAADRVFEVDPEHRMTRLLVTLLNRGVNPQVWEDHVGPPTRGLG
jgi:hypothetical protein